MNILMLNGPDQKMGAPKSLFGICVEWKKQKIDMVVLTQNYGDLNNNLDSIGVKNYKIPYRNILTKSNHKILRRIRELFLNRISLMMIRRIMKQNKFDAIYSSSSIFRFGAEVAEKYNIPHIWHIREFGYDDYELVPIKSDYYNYMNNHCDKFISISNAIRECWIKKGLDENKIINIYNGINPDLITPKNYDQRVDDRIKIIISGSISKAKGQYQLIDAVASLSEIERDKIVVDVWGTSPDHAYMESLVNTVRRLNLKNINFRGYNSNLNSILNQYDIGVVASKSEGFGRVTVEYMMARLCVLASNTGANKELIKDGYDGILYDYNSVKSLAMKLHYLIENAEVRKKLAEAGREKAINSFTAKRNADEILSIIENSISIRKGSRQ